MDIVERLRHKSPENDMEIGQIKMRTPGGQPSRITVTLRDNGTVDIHLTRSEEGEALFVLPQYAAKRLGELLTAAVKVKETVAS